MLQGVRGIDAPAEEAYVSRNSLGKLKQNRRFVHDLIISINICPTALLKKVSLTVFGAQIKPAADAAYA